METNQPVYDEFYFPGMEGKIYDVKDPELYKHPIRVKFGNQEGFYSMDGVYYNSKERKPTLSYQPYKVKFKGFVPIKQNFKPTLEDAIDWLTKNNTNDVEKIMAQLYILKEYYNGGWKPNFKSDQWKFTISNHKGELIKDVTIRSNKNSFIFKTAEIRDNFLKNQRDLLEKIKHLL